MRGFSPLPALAGRATLFAARAPAGDPLTPACSANPDGGFSPAHLLGQNHRRPGQARHSTCVPQGPRRKAGPALLLPAGSREAPQRARPRRAPDRKGGRDRNVSVRLQSLTENSTNDPDMDALPAGFRLERRVN